MSVSIRAFFPDAHLKDSDFSRALTSIAVELARRKSDPVQQSVPEVEIQFMLSGKFDAPGFTGMRIRRFDSKDNILVVDTAIPDHMVNSPKAEEYIVAAMMDAVENAAEFLHELALTFDQGRHMALVNSLLGIKEKT